MSKKILHLNDDYVLDRDFSVAGLLDFLEEIASELFGAEESLYMVSITTRDDDYFHHLTFSELERYCIIFKHVMTSITLKETKPQHPFSERYIGVYIDVGKENKELTFTIKTASKEECAKIEKQVEGLLKEQLRAARKRSKFSDSKSFLFDTPKIYEELKTVVKELSEWYMESTPFRFDIYSQYGELLTLEAEEMDRFWDGFAPGEYKMLTIRKRDKYNSGFELFLYFNDELPGFAYYSVQTDTASSGKQLKDLLNRLFNLSTDQQRSLKSALARSSANIGTFKINPRLEPGQLVDFMEMISENFLKGEQPDLSYLNADNSCYTHDKVSFIQIFRLFENSGAGNVYLTKKANKKKGYQLLLNCYGTHKMGFYRIDLGHPADNEVMHDLLIKSMGVHKKETKPGQKSGIRPQLQGAFFFPVATNPDAFIRFLEKLSKFAFPEDFMVLRLTCSSGKKHLYHDEDYTELKNKIKEDRHSLIYISKKTKQGVGFSLNLQFKDNDADTPNGYYSIIGNNDKENIKIRKFVLDNLRRTAEKPEEITDNRTEDAAAVKLAQTPYSIFSQQDFKTQQYGYIRINENNKTLRQVLTSCIEAAGLTCVHSDGLEGFKVLDNIWKYINEAKLVIIDISGQNRSAFYELGIAHTLGKQVILLVQNPKELPFDFKPFKHIIYEADKAGLMRMQAELEAYLEE